MVGVDVQCGSRVTVAKICRYGCHRNAGLQRERSISVPKCMGTAYLLAANVVVGRFLNELIKRFGIAENDDTAAYVERNNAINRRIESGDLPGIKVSQPRV